jgi:hypothetical protein
VARRELVSSGSATKDSHDLWVASLCQAPSRRPVLGMGSCHPRLKGLCARGDADERNARIMFS